MKLVAEQCTVICTSILQKEIRRIINRDHPNSTEEEVFNLTERELANFSTNDQSFKFTHIKNKLGGYRWFFLCEKCGKRVLKLFLPPEAYRTYTHKYYCKHCHGIFNESVMKSGNNLYRKVVRPLRRLREIEEMLEKGHLLSQKVEDLLNEYEKIEQDIKSCPEYRHYAFKKKRGMKII